MNHTENVYIKYNTDITNCSNLWNFSEYCVYMCNCVLYRINNKGARTQN